MKDIKLIKGLINEDILQKYVDLVNISIDVMKYLDNFEGEFNIGYSSYSSDMTTPIAIIEKFRGQKIFSSYLIDRDLTNIISRCHVLGWKFYIAHELSGRYAYDILEKRGLINPHQIEKEDHIEKVIESVTGANLVSYEKAKAYTTELIKRFECRVKEKAEKHKYK